MKVDYIEETTVRKALAFEVEAEVVQAEIDRRAKQLAKKAKLPGFRPGKTPPSVVKNRFRNEIFSETAEALVNKVVFEELEGRGLKPLGSPQVEQLRIEEGKPMTFRAVFEILPLVDAPEWKGLQVSVAGAKVSDEDVDKQVDRLREEAARFDPVEDRPAKKGDHVVVDLVWEPHEGGKGGRDENALIEIGHEGNHEDMNAALEGMAVGDTKTIDVTWGPDAAPAVAGKTVRYTLNVKGIKDKIVPAADDEFAKDLGEFDSLAELREKLRKQLEEAEEQRVERDTRAALIEALVAKARFEVPEVLIEHHMTQRTENLARGLARQGLDPNKVGVDWREYRETQRDDSVKAARADVLLGEIAQREDVKVLEAEIQAEVARIAEQFGKSPESLRLQMQKDGDLGALTSRIREDKVLDLLKANATIELT
ncbi:MAG: trigger factor [Acidobacteria bacterium]|nr:trigger factor [Acidobacteriota bacterium]